MSEIEVKCTQKKNNTIYCETLVKNKNNILTVNSGEGDNELVCLINVNEISHIVKMK